MQWFFPPGINNQGMQGNLPPEAQEKIQELKDLQEKAQQVSIQRQQAEAELSDAENALDALEEIDTDSKMYREVGELFIETDYESAQDDLEERADGLEIRVQTLEKQEDRVREQFEQLQEELQQLLQGSGLRGIGGPGAGG